MSSDVILTRAVRECGLRAGGVGTIVERHIVPGATEEGYAVEFFDMTGSAVAVAGEKPNARVLPGRSDRNRMRVPWLRAQPKRV